jgi:type II secretory pathway component PulM
VDAVAPAGPRERGMLAGVGLVLMLAGLFGVLTRIPLNNGHERSASGWRSVRRRGASPGG